MLNDAIYRLRSLFQRRAVDGELEDELRFHLEQSIQKKLAAGVSPEEAHRQARIEFGGLDQVRLQCREARGVGLLTMLQQDVRYGLRMMVKDRGFTTVTSLIIALGIGATTVMFAVVDALLIRPLPYKDADRLVFIAEAYERKPGMSVSLPNFRDWEAQNTVFSAMAGTQPRALTLTGLGLPQQLDVRCVTHEWFSTLRLTISQGRDFTSGDDTQGAQPVAILSHEFWQRQFAGDRSVLGRSLTLDQRSFTIIGIAPPKAHYRTQQPEVYLPINVVANAAERTQRSAHGGMYAVARLKDGVTLEQARANMDTIAERLQQLYPETNNKDWVSLRLLQAYIVGNVRTGLLILLAAVALLLLIVCANVANLLLARASSRSRELAIRASLGASRARIITQMLTESLLLASVGGVVGVFLAYWGTAYLVHAGADALPRVGDIRVNGPVLAFAVIVTIGTGILFGALPAWHAAASNLNLNLKEGGRVSAGVERQRMRGMLIVAELALSFALLVGSGLLIRSFIHVMQVDPGFDPHNVLTATIVMPENKSTDSDRAERFMDEVMRNIRVIPGVLSASTIVPLPLSGNEWDTNYLLEGQQLTKEFRGTNTEVGNLGAGYAKTMQVPLLSGRMFDENDTTKSQPVAVVNAEFAQKTWPEQNPLGKRIRLLSPEEFSGSGTKQFPWRTVVGVIGNVKQYGLDDRTVATLYLPIAQPDDPKDPLLRRDLVIRTGTAPQAIVDQVRRAVAAANRDQATSEFQTMEQYIAESLAPRQLYVTLLTLFAAAAMVLATVGIYGVIAYWVGERRREIGIRLAIGAQRSNILRLVLGRSLRFVAIGTVLGGLASLALAQALRSLLFRVRAIDVGVFCIVAAMLATVALLASYVPARSATRIAPAEAVRCE